MGDHPERVAADEHRSAVSTPVGRGDPLLELGGQLGKLKLEPLEIGTGKIKILVMAR